MTRPPSNVPQRAGLLAPATMLAAIVTGCAMLPTTALAQDTSPPAHAEQSEADKQLHALLEAHEASELGYRQAYEAFLPRFTEFAQTHRGSEAEARATLWLIQQAWWLRTENKMEATAFPLAEDLIKRHPDSPQLDLLIEYHYVFTRAQKEQLYNRLLEVSPHKAVQGAAHFGLARLNAARNAAGEPNIHYQKLIDEFADQPWRFTTLGAIADAKLNPHTPDELAVGQTAPEIEGIDNEGAPMRLSDYRGKVIMLDFWGHW